MSAAEPRHRTLDEDEPDPRLLLRWVSGAVRPYVGWILIGCGALVMLIGYFGVSREAIPAKQIPYLVSGGIGGVFLAVVGAYFLGTQEMRKDSGRLDRLEQMVEELHGALLRRADAPAGSIQADTEQGSNGSTNGSTSGAVHAPARRVGVVDGGEMFHRLRCSMVEGKDDVEELTTAAARKRGLRPCPVCTPAPADAPV